ncbi:uncharacterized protein B4U79_16526 [Dinothrombium tinctorium]|uniref:CUB domain-containing protein n=1 Tax=Dinothrombium tinctorium TaxID=1965070 RepID=A0A3S3P8H4_9ACAR|nr:uncharacterized protein B4U79_16526 [Dinothrombium tinctorium]
MHPKLVLLLVVTFNCVHCNFILNKLGLAPAIPCIGTLSQKPGSCLAAEVCAQRGQVIDGECLANAGLCCIPVVRCNGVIDGNNTYFANFDFPNATEGNQTICTLTVKKMSGLGIPNVVSIKLEFEVFDIASVSSDSHKCDEDSFTVEGVNARLPTLCGQNKNQHIYIPIDIGNVESFKIKIKLSDSTTIARKWLIRVLQLGEGNPSIAPRGCLQYHSSLEGSIKSFNFDDSNNVGNGNIAGLNYAVCLRQQIGYCQIKVKALSFAMSSVSRKKRTPQSDSQISIPADVYERLMKASAEFNHLYAAGLISMPTLSPATMTSATGEQTSWQLSEVTTSETMTSNENEADSKTSSGSEMIANRCTQKDRISFSSIVEHKIIPVFCGERFAKRVTMKSEPYIVRVENTGKKHGKGFALQYTQTICKNGLYF